MTCRSRSSTIPSPTSFTPGTSVTDKIKNTSTLSANSIDPGMSVVLRSSDEAPVDFTIYKALLIISSPFFAELLSLPQPPDTPREEMSEGSAIIQMAEPAEAIERLLPFVYPRFVTMPHLATLEELQTTLQMASKYDMKGVEKCLGEVLVAPRFVEEDPMRVFAMACRYGLEDAARIAAKHTLRLSLPERHYVAEMEHISAGNLQRLVDYYFACSAVAAAVARDFSWVMKDTFSFFHRGGCSCGASTYVLIAGGSMNVPARAWWLNYMKRMGEALKERPSLATLMKRDLMEEVFEKTKTCACGRKTILDMLEFREIFSAELDKRISEVELVLNL
ncbi:hypothetical protein PC9H_006689 [Pleurotus ostreatus]|uniref:BTB domain-containing protein n=1 Tax=Pleurotus ostreatus TaxID=5322 RepID=A0A8H6ZU93_PLEOS|nr:uncharacterized protein PC9H_006689 [Pleurotus ostreatus]KAF7430974.1 hypothetical protein PC9H_006689 [Pleurotus ostreatus]KAJ8695359.1 hypothetical protein PTI98_007962 [Pleurotus ostreatus]